MRKFQQYFYVFFLFIIIISVICFFKNSGNKITIYSFSQNTQSVSEINLPLPKPSSITDEKNRLRLDLEKISVNKYYIIYSVIYGNQSHTAYHLYLTDLKRKTLHPDFIKDIYLLNKDNNYIYPTAEKPVITAFPKDQPLGWKLGIVVKFPYYKSRKNHSLVLTYKETKLKLNNINY